MFNYEQENKSLKKKIKMLNDEIDELQEALNEVVSGELEFHLLDIEELEDSKDIDMLSSMLEKYMIETYNPNNLLETIGSMIDILMYNLAEEEGSNGEFNDDTLKLIEQSIEKTPLPIAIALSQGDRSVYALQDAMLAFFILAQYNILDEDYE